MRSSSRSDIIEAALRVVDTAEGPDITYESVSREVGLSKAGLMYHFPTKDAMMVAVMEHVVDRWKRELIEVLAVPLESSTLAERVRAFVRFAGVGGVTQGEFVVFAEAVRRSELSAPWLNWLRTWFGFGATEEAVPLLLVWLAANGLWIAEASGILNITDAQRERLVENLVGMIEGSRA